MDTDVLIVGAGPTGLMLACQLALYKIPFRIIDRTEDHTTQSRALVIHARSMEIFDQMDIAGKIFSRGEICKLFGLIFNGKKVIDIYVTGEGLTKFPYLLILAQSETELILNEYLE